MTTDALDMGALLAWNKCGKIAYQGLVKQGHAERQLGRSISSQQSGGPATIQIRRMAAMGRRKRT